jgi:pimeloyl-ACP methyl ester carboxylesterase
MPRVRLQGGELDGLELHYVTAGRGPVTLLVHGLAGFADYWRYTVEGLGSQGRVVALDLPGSGQSAKPRRPYDLDFFVRALDRLLEALDLPRVRLVGHSLGGAVAAAYALARPGRVERLALVSPAVPGFPLTPSLALRLLAVRGLGELLARCITRRVVEAALARCFWTPKPEEVAFLLERQWGPGSTAEARAAYLATLRGLKEDFVRKAPAYRVGFGRWERPVLVIHGQQDPIIPLAHARAVVEGMPRARGYWLDQCGHFPHLEHPAVVNGWLGDFLFAGASR